MDNKNHGILMSLALAGIAIRVWAEVSSLWTVEQNWVRLLSLTGKMTISLYLVFLLFGVYSLLIGSWRTEVLNRLARRWSVSPATRWGGVALLLLVFTYIYLYSVWQTILSQPWTQLLFAMGFAHIILFIAAPQREQRFGWSELALTIGLFLYPRVVHETRALFADLERDFVVVDWDQRGVGKSYAALDPPATWTLDQAVSDTIEQGAETVLGL